ncbi:heavy-metal-associated domain-containing protein [Salirhabdus salicampi]|uniref:heavy-metal-associated domain-containing protein n=1 Tax=Salirhabdus salicampi TaxID=476102 RepID=UPI0020C5B148|nr:heavy metal-associated domain-containing protein [Salirhabdus salicampi]MCP8617038.1 hypothetical protein [Salirhabdus salicampi]
MGHSTFFIKEAKEQYNIETLEQTLMNLNGIERALVDTNDGELKLEYDEKQIPLTDIVAHIESRGFHIEQ